MDRKAKADGTVLAAVALVNADMYRMKMRNRRAVLADHLMALADELTESLNIDEKQAFTCPRHLRPIDKRPTICPLCALVAARIALDPLRDDSWQ